MKKIIFIGGGSFAREIESVAKDNDLNVIGYIDQKRTASSFKYLGNFKKLTSSGISFDYIFLAIGAVDKKSINLRKKFIEFIKTNKLPTTSIISKSSIIEKQTKIFPGAFVGHGCIVSIGASIGPYSVLNSGAILGHDSIIKNNVIIAPRAFVAGNVLIKANTIIGPGSNLIQNITIGSNAVIGVGSNVLRSVKNNTHFLTIQNKKLISS